MTVKPSAGNQAETTRTFGASRRNRRLAAIILGLMFAPLIAIAFTPAARQSGLSTWGNVAVLGLLAVIWVWAYAAITRPAVFVSDGKVTVRNVLHSRTIDVSGIRAITLEAVDRDSGPYWVPAAELTDGTLIHLDPLSCGRVRAPLPPSPQRFAAYNEFRVLVGLPADPQLHDAPSDHSSAEIDDAPPSNCTG